MATVRPINVERGLVDPRAVFQEPVTLSNINWTRFSAKRTQCGNTSAALGDAVWMLRAGASGPAAHRLRPPENPATCRRSAKPTALVPIGTSRANLWPLATRSHRHGRARTG